MNRAELKFVDEVIPYTTKKWTDIDDDVASKLVTKLNEPGFKFILSHKLINWLCNGCEQ